MSTPTPLKFPQAGWLRHRLKPLQRSRSLMERLKAVSVPKKEKPSLDRLQALKNKYAKG